ncbi:MAG: nitroreductase family protein [Thaumarchaeota archaeon]|nr:nitroreductase family protein [Nitrososphaerota archaeon]MCL5069151.1 nitroreductase family protein [Nitrososphaerota archaeon]
METFEALARRRACREYSKDPVPRGILEKLVYAGGRAPTACNMPYRHFIVVDDQRVIKSIRQLSPSLLADPPVLILVIVDLKVAIEETGPLAEFSAYVDSGAAGENILLAAADLGLGSQFTMIPVMAGIREILNLPSNFRVDLIIPIGYQKDEASKRSVRAQKNANSAFRNRYGEKF